MKFDPLLYVILDPRIYGVSRLTDVAQAAVLGGATVLQLRDKSATDGELLAMACSLVELANAADVPLIVNDRADVAREAGAAGVHLGPEDMAIAEARRILGSEAIIGFSAGTTEEATMAEAAGADYLGTGDVYGTTSKADADAPIGLAGLEAVTRATRLPVVAVGGIGLGTAAPCIAAGAAGVAVISAVGTAEWPAATAKALREEMETARMAAHL